MLTKREQWLWDNLTVERNNVSIDLYYGITIKGEPDLRAGVFDHNDEFVRWRSIHTDADGFPLPKTAKRFEEICRLKVWGL